MRDAICSRPAAFVCSVFVLFAIFTAIIAVPGENIRVVYVLIILSVVFALAFTAILVYSWITSYRRERKHTFFLRVIACAMLLVSIAVALSSLFYGVIPRNIAADYCGEDRKITFTLEECSYYSSYGATYLVVITALDGEEISVPATLVCKGERDLSVGDMASTVCDISSAEMYDSTLLSRLYFAAQGRYLIADADEEPFTDRGEFESVSATLYRIRRSLSSDIDVRLGRDEGGLVAALMLGERSGLSSQVSSNFRLLGISHIIAISGMHLSLMIVAIELLLRQMRLPAVVRGIIVTVIAVLYAALTGFSASVSRAVVMLIIAKAAPIFSRRGDPVTSLCITVFVIMLVSPGAVTDVGLLLSFAATLGIVTLGARWQKALDGICSKWEARFSGDKDDTAAESIEELFRNIEDKNKNEPKQNPFDKLACVGIGIISYFSSVILMSIAATVFTLPLTMAFFGSLSILFLPANLIFVPLSTVLLISSPFVLLLGIPFIPAPISSLVYGIVADFSRAVIFLSRKMASLSNDAMIISLPEIVITALIPILVFLIFRCILVKNSRVYYRMGPCKARTVTVAVTVFATVTTFLSSSLIYGYLGCASTSVSYFTSGNDECIMLRDGRDDVLIDISCGEKSLVNAAARKADNGSPDSIVLTHVRDLHVTVYKTLIAQMYPEKLYLPVPVDDDDRYLTESLTDLAEKSDTEVVFYSPRQTITFSNYCFTVTEYTVPTDKTHPVICFELVPLGEGDTLSYIGGDFRSCLDDHGRVSYMSMTSPDHLIIGGHDPTAEREIENYGRNAETVLYGSKTVYELNKSLGGPTTQRIQVYVKDGIGLYSTVLRKDK